MADRVLWQDGDQLDEDNLAAVAAKSNQTDYVERGLDLDPDFGADTLDVSAGHAVIQDGDRAYDVFPDARSGLALPDSDGVNDVYATVDPDASNELEIAVIGDGSTPADPHLKIGEVDTAAGTSREQHRAPAVSAEELNRERWVDASEGPSAVQDALDESGVSTVYVYNPGTYSWGDTVEVPDNTTLEILSGITIEVPSEHSLSTYEVRGDTCQVPVTNKNRSDPEDVVIRGGVWDLDAVNDDTNTFGVWLHNGDGGCLIDSVEVHDVWPDNLTNDRRGFGIVLSDCDRSEIRDSEAHDSQYDDIRIMGDCRDCKVIRSGGTGGGSGTIQMATWMPAGGGQPHDTRLVDCWGERIYEHGSDDHGPGRGTVFDGCEPENGDAPRIQLLGDVRDITIKNSVLTKGHIRPVSQDSNMLSQITISDCVFRTGPEIDQAEAPLERAIWLQTQGGGSEIKNLTIENCHCEREGFVRYDIRDSGDSIDYVDIQNCQHYSPSEGSGSFVSWEDEEENGGHLRVDSSKCVDAFQGISGEFEEVRIRHTEGQNLTNSLWEGSATGDVIEHENDEW